MIRCLRFCLAGLALMLLTSVGRADEKDKKPAKNELPIQAKLIVKKATYKLDLGGVTSAAFEKLIKDAEKGEGRVEMPSPQAVDVVLELKNTSRNDVKIWSGGDPVTVSLKLTGPGAVTARPNLAFTLELRPAVELSLGAGKTHSIAIQSLQFGHRGVAERVYWTKPGDYTLTATFNTALNPPPKGVKAEDDGFGKVSLTTPPVKLKVEAAKK